MKKIDFKNIEIKKYFEMKLVKIFLSSATIIFLAGIIFCLYDFFSQEENQPVLVTATVEEVSENPKQETKKQVLETRKENLFSIPANPFISNKELAARTAEKISVEPQQNSTVVSSSQMSLPPIPKIEMPKQPVKIPSIGERKIVNPLTMSEEKLPSADVKGIITTDDGKSIAIMSDGKVLSEGESYMDGRIAYIGGDGVEIDNGKKIKFKE